MTKPSFKIMTIGWEPSFIEYLLGPIEKTGAISFAHALVGDALRLNSAKRHYPDRHFIALGKSKSDALPPPDYSLLRNIEAVGVPTVKSMIRGDRVLRYLPPETAFAYASMLAKRIKEVLELEKPDVVLASNDSLHSGMSLAVAKYLGIPWVALAYTVIPDDRTGFLYALRPDHMLPLGVEPDEALVVHAKALIASVRNKKQGVLAFRAPLTFSQYMRQYIQNVRNLIHRYQTAHISGMDAYTFPSAFSRLRDLARRGLNRFTMSEQDMIRTPPEGKYVYFPLHMSPESMIDTWAPFYQDQLSFAKQLVHSLPADMDLVVKLHFSDPDNYSRRQLNELMHFPRVRVAHPAASGALFLEQATLVVGMTGTSCLEAALRGIPVLIFADSPYQHFPRTRRADAPDRIHAQILDLLAQPAPSEDEILSCYVSFLARFRPGRINDWARPIALDEQARYADCFCALRTYIEQRDCRVNWYNNRPFVA